MSGDNISLRSVSRAPILGKATSSAWVVDCPDGSFMLTAEAYEKPIVDLAKAPKLAQSVIDTLEFVGS